MWRSTPAHPMDSTWRWRWFLGQVGFTDPKREKSTKDSGHHPAMRMCVFMCFRPPRPDAPRRPAHPPLFEHRAAAHLALGLGSSKREKLHLCKFSWRTSKGKTLFTEGGGADGRMPTFGAKRKMCPLGSPIMRISTVSAKSLAFFFFWTNFFLQWEVKKMSYAKSGGSKKVGPDQNVLF